MLAFFSKTKFPVFLVTFCSTIALLYWFSYILPFTNNAFVVANIRPVAAYASGYITDIFVRNEQFVKKGQPILVVFQQPYQLAYAQAKSQLEAAQSNYLTYQKVLAKDQSLLQQYQEQYEKANFIYQRGIKMYVYHAVSEIELSNWKHDTAAAKDQVLAQVHQVEVDKQNIISQAKTVDALTAQMKNAKVSLDQTTVYAASDGIIQNMFVSLGTPIQVNQPLFSFIDQQNLFIQANFNETDLTKVRTGNQVIIIPRMYFGYKVYHGVVVSKNWAANRQSTDQRYQIQNVTNNADSWILLPQRFPVQIKITDYDHAHYPLSVGASTYVYIKTH